MLLEDRDGVRLLTVDRTDKLNAFTAQAFPKPLIGATNGVAVGFGATLLLHRDLVVIDEAAEVRLPLVALGTCVEAGSSWLLPHRVGAQQALWSVLSGRALSADEAVAAGSGPIG